MLRGVRLEKRLVVVKRNCLAVQVGVLVVRCFEVAERVNELAVVRSILNQKVSNAVGNGQVSVALHFQIMLTGLGCARASCPNVD